MSRMPAGDWVGSTEAAVMARCHRNIVMQAIEKGELSAYVMPNQQRKRILIQRKEAQRWALTQLKDKPSRPMPYKYPKLSPTHFIAAMLALYEAGKVRSSNWQEAAGEVLCNGQDVSTAAKNALLSPNSLSRPLLAVARAAESLSDAQLMRAESLIGPEDNSPALWVQVASQAAQITKLAKNSTAVQKWKARSNLKKLDVLKNK